MQNFKKLISLCDYSVEISVNNHKDCHQTIEEYIIEDQNYVDPLILHKMNSIDTMVRVIAYPDSPIGYFAIYHYDIDEAINIALNKILKQNHK